MQPLIIIKAGTAPAEVIARRGDFEAWIAPALGVADESLRVVEVWQDEPLPQPRTVRGAIVTGSAAMVSYREAWSERTGQWLARATAEGVPLLGICYGHQLLAQALGGRVGPNPHGRQIGTVEVHLTPAAREDPLLGRLPLAIPMQTSHVESVLALPSGARLLATTERDPHHAFVIGKSAWGIQFHPEFDADVMRGYIDARRDILRHEDFDPDQLSQAAFDTPHGTTILRRFARQNRSNCL